MMQKRISIFFLALQILIPLTWVVPDTSGPWEKSDITSRGQDLHLNKPVEKSILKTALAKALVVYQEKQSDKTIHRCAFHTSCSSFLPEAIESYGLPIGVIAFLDRYLIRENKSAYFHYKLKKKPDGVFKLDDDSFLEK